MKYAFWVKNWDWADDVVWRQPFPGPGLAIRIIGEVTAQRLSMLRKGDTILIEEIRANKLYYKLWQSFAVLLPLKSVGIMGDQRTYENILAIRAVTSDDAMTADWAPLPHDIMARYPTALLMKCAASTALFMISAPNRRAPSSGNDNFYKENI